MIKPGIVGLPGYHMVFSKKLDFNAMVYARIPHQNVHL
jgi:hypothetical protein